MTCIKCGKDHGDYRFRVLRVETLHVRDIGKESRVQALGDFEEDTVCADCAEANLRQRKAELANLGKICLPYGAMILLGALIAWLFRGDTPIFLFGGGMLVCGAACLYGKVTGARSRAAQLNGLEESEAMYQSAWECLVECAPKKNDVNDITYIPVDEQTLARKNGDLMILYDLLPEIAIEAHKRIHGIETE